MTNNSEGLSPTLRPQLGVGWNRALPAPFQFNNGIFPDGVNDYLQIPSLNGKTFQSIMPLSIEFWGRGQPSGNKDLLQLIFTDSTYYTWWRNGNGKWYLPNPGGGPQPELGNYEPPDSRWQIALSLEEDWNTGNGYRNGLHVARANSQVLTAEKIISSAVIFKGNHSYWNYHIDEFRIYKGGISADEVGLNWNDGVGNNPAKTEGLVAWYKFEEFENLDFSDLQDNSDIRLGIRDLSGNNNHAVPVNMDTDPNSPNYVLKPF